MHESHNLVRFVNLPNTFGIEPLNMLSDIDLKCNHIRTQNDEMGYIGRDTAGPS